MSLAAVLLASTFVFNLDDVPPSPQLDVRAWQATDIVVVSEGAEIDGNVEVLETWKGRLTRGERIDVPELAAFASEESRKVSKVWLIDEPVAPPVTGMRMLLFLIRGGDRWLPARDDMKSSTTWFEDGRAFEFTRVERGGPIVLATYNNREADFRTWTDRVIAAQLALRDARAAEDALPALVRAKSAYVMQTAISSFGAAGPKAVPALQRILADESLDWYHDEAVQALAKAHAEAAVSELTELLAADLDFWKAAAPSLRAGWWNDFTMPQPEERRLKARYARTFAVLTVLRRIEAPGAAETLAALRGLWQSYPQLSSVGGGQIERACDEALAASHAAR